LAHVTWQLPAQSASQVEAFVHVIVLPSPAATPQVVALLQSKTHSSPQIVPHVWMLKQLIAQPLPHDAVHVGTSWQVELHSLLQTRPSPLHPRAHTLPFEHEQASPGAHPSSV
jgi:hypothetical protein